MTIVIGVSMANPPENIFKATQEKIRNALQEFHDQTGLLPQQVVFKNVWIGLPLSDDPKERNRVIVADVSMIVRSPGEV